jgi:hypothetical protein
MFSNEGPAAAAGKGFKGHVRGTGKRKGEGSEARTDPITGDLHHHIEDAPAVGTDIGECVTYVRRSRSIASCVGLGYASKLKTEGRKYCAFD